jgi:RNA polymerase sigma-70 factor (ECF subfamily)
VAQTQNALLVVRAQLGDRRALADLVRHWHEPVWQYLRRMLDRPGVADDVSQEVWAIALKALPGLREADRFAPWLFTIARRAVLNHLRERYRQGEVISVAEPADSLEPDQLAGAGDEADLALDRVEVGDSLADLPPPEREVLVLYYLHDLSLGECAQVLQIPPGTVKSRLFRARRILKDRLIEKGYRA